MTPLEALGRDYAINFSTPAARATLEHEQMKHEKALRTRQIAPWRVVATPGCRGVPGPGIARPKPRLKGPKK